MVIYQEDGHQEFLVGVVVGEEEEEALAGEEEALVEEEEGLEEDDVEVEDDGRSMIRQSTKRPFGAICLITRNVN